MELENIQDVGHYSPLIIISPIIGNGEAGI